MNSRLGNTTIRSGYFAIHGWLAIALLAMSFTSPLAANEVEPIPEGPYTVGTTNLQVTDEFVAYTKIQRDADLNGHFNRDGEREFFTERLKYPDAAWVINVEVPDDRATYGNIAGISLPVVMYISYPTTPDNNREPYPFPFPDAEDNDLHHMQGPGDQPVFADDQASYPMVLISHGRGVHGIWEVGHARRLASHGYIAVTVNYGDLRIQDPDKPFLDTLFRPLAGKAVLDHVLASEQFGGHIDPSRIATFGHSLGGFTSLALAGGRYLDNSGSFHDSRIKAVVAASPWVGGGGFSGEYFLFGDENMGLADISVPVFVTFGTTDTSTPKKTILPAMEHLSGPRYIVEFIGQPHIYEPGSWQDLANWELLFLSAHLKDDAQALETLRTASSMKGGNRDIQHFDLQRLPDSKAYHLWKNGAPGFEHLKDEPEQARDWWVKNIHNPSITAFFPDKSIATGASVLIFPGGGHRELVFDAEGTEAAEILNSIGVAAFVLKYRLAREDNSPYSLPEHSRQDAERAMRFIRSHSTEWSLDKDRVGVMGFSAGGEVAAFIAYDEGMGNINAVDPIDRERAQPDFQILIYPGPMGYPETIPPNAPPAFMLAAFDDPCCVQPVIDLLRSYKQAEIPAEVHIYDSGGHGFNLGQRSGDRSLSSWPDRLIDWLVENGIARRK